MTTAQESFSFRLEAAADLAQSLSQRLYDLAGHEPTPEALYELRSIENSLDVCSRLSMRDLEAKAIDTLAGYDHRAGSDEPEDRRDHERDDADLRASDERERARDMNKAGR